MTQTPGRLPALIAIAMLWSGQVTAGRSMAIASSMTAIAPKKAALFRVAIRFDSPAPATLRLLALHNQRAHLHRIVTLPAVMAIS